MAFVPKNRKWLTWEHRAKILSVTEIVKRVCGVEHKDAFLIAKNACVFRASKRYAGGKTAATGYD